MSDQDWMKDWNCEYRAHDYIEGSHPMDTDDVTWHHIWEKPKPPVALPLPADENQTAEEAGVTPEESPLIPSEMETGNEEDSH